MIQFDSYFSIGLKRPTSLCFQERRLRHFFATLGCILISATAFAFVHWPDPWLMAGTGLMGIPWAIEYLLHRNVLPLGLYLDYQRTVSRAKTQVV